MGSFPKKGLSLFDFMSPTKEKSLVVLCLESLKWLRKLYKGPFLYDLVSKAWKGVKLYLRELFQSWLAGVFLFS